MRKILILILFFVSSVSVFASQPKQNDYSFVNMNMQSHGLSNDGVRCMLLDKDGYHR